MREETIGKIKVGLEGRCKDFSSFSVWIGTCMDWEPMQGLNKRVTRSDFLKPHSS